MKLGRFQSWHLEITANGLKIINSVKAGDRFDIV